MSMTFIPLADINAHSPRSSLRIRVAGDRLELADGLFQQGPGLGAELRLPVRVETAGAQGVAERLGVNLVEDDARRLHFGGRLFVEAQDVLTLLRRSVRKRGGDGGANVLRQCVPADGVGEDVVAVPDMAGQRYVFLDFVELCTLDQRQRVLLAVDHMGL